MTIVILFFWEKIAIMQIIEEVEVTDKWKEILTNPENQEVYSVINFYQIFYN